MPARRPARSGTPAAIWRRCTDFDPYGAEPWGVWFNRVHSFEAGEGEGARTVHFPKSCLHCEEPACVTVCPTGASYKRAEDGIVLVNEAICIGCKLCSWACPYGAREFDADDGVMKKCTLCIDRIYNENLAPEERAAGLRHGLPGPGAAFRRSGRPRLARSRGLVAERRGGDLMPELGYRPINKYLPPRPRRMAPTPPPSVAAPPERGHRDGGCCAGSTGCCSADASTVHPALLDHLLHDRLRRRLRAVVAARHRRAARPAAGERALRLCRARDRARCSPPAGSPPRSFTSAGPSGPGAPFRNGARPGSRARGCSRS